MATLDTKDRDKLRSSQFAYVDSDGGEHLPINDESHVRNAIARFNQTEFESKAAKERATQEGLERRQALRHRRRQGLDGRQADPLAASDVDEGGPPRRSQEGLTAVERGGLGDDLQRTPSSCAGRVRIRGGGAHASACAG